MSEITTTSRIFSFAEGSIEELDAKINKLFSLLNANKEDMTIEHIQIGQTYRTYESRTRNKKGIKGTAEFYNIPYFTNSVVVSFKNASEAVIGNAYESVVSELTESEKEN